MGSRQGEPTPASPLKRASLGNKMAKDDEKPVFEVNLTVLARGSRGIRPHFRLEDYLYLLRWEPRLIDSNFRHRRFIDI